MSKSIFKSKTFWLGLASTAFGAYQTAVMADPSASSKALMVVGVGGMILRTFTNQPVHVVSGDPQ